ncbi:MAG: hypothetical protein IKR93_07130 [Firmicutes bacterium]|nr:hypothetical protein [Bacillota bacterium]
MSSWHIGIAAEAYTAAIFARYGYDVSVQYGANQPEYDLIAVSGDKMLKISVKGSQDGGWGLTQNYKKGCNYHEAVDKWLSMHHKKTVFCLVQFQGTAPDEIPRIYLAAPGEIALLLKSSAGGRGETVLRENHAWGPCAVGKGTIDRIPKEWRVSAERLQYLFNTYGQ